MSFIEEGKGSCMISLHKRTLSNKTQCVASQEAGGRAISNCWEPINRKLRRNSFFSLKFLTWQNFRKHNFSEINKRRSKVREYSLKVKKKNPFQVEGLLFMGCGVLGMDTGAHEGWASTSSYPCYPKELQVQLTYIWFLLYLWNKLYMMEPPWSSAREAMSSTPSSFMGCIGVTFWWVIVLCL